MTARDLAIGAFLGNAGWGNAAHAPLAGDASARHYRRLVRGSDTAILMDSPIGGADDPAQFVAIAQHLLALNLSPPRILAQDLAQGLLLLEDLGSGVFAHVLHSSPQREMALYRSAVDVLAHIQTHPAPAGLPNLSAKGWADAALFAPRHYSAALLGRAPDDAALQSALTEVLIRHADAPRVMILRDYHAENLMDLPSRQGLAQVGLLDFQLAQMGQPAYDLVSLLQDARRDVSPTTQSAIMAHWLNISGTAEAAFSASYAAIGTQRALRILGIFASLCTQQGKAGYLPLIPRVWADLQRNLAHPALRDVAQICAGILPPPTTAALNSLRLQCKNHP
jgi:hypothetical protein